MRTFAIVFAFVALFGVSSAQLIQEHPFLIGYHVGLELGADTQLITRYIDGGHLDAENLTENLAKVSSSDPDTSFVGLQNVVEIFKNLASRAKNIINTNENFTTLMNYTLEIFSSPEVFLQTADVLRKSRGYEVLTKIIEVVRLARNGDYYSSGLNFGWVVSVMHPAMRRTAAKSSMGKVANNIINTLRRQ